MQDAEGLACGVKAGGVAGADAVHIGFRNEGLDNPALRIDHHRQRLAGRNPRPGRGPCPRPQLPLERRGELQAGRFIAECAGFGGVLSCWPLELGAPLFPVRQALRPASSRSLLSR
jgi:hypothetical protein